VFSLSPDPELVLSHLGVLGASASQILSRSSDRLELHGVTLVVSFISAWDVWRGLLAHATSPCSSRCGECKLLCGATECGSCNLTGMLVFHMSCHSLPSESRPCSSSIRSTDKKHWHVNQLGRQMIAEVHSLGRYGATNINMILKPTPRQFRRCATAL
jgi:hypothetical protein